MVSGGVQPNSTTDEGEETLSDAECAPPGYLPHTKDDDYYFSYLVFVVEGRLFNVPRHYFKKSPVFVKMFRLPIGDKMADGAIVIDNVSAADFKALLKLLIPMPGKDKEDLTKSEWLGILNLSTMWSFGEFRETAISKLTKEKMDAVDRILLGYKYDIATWLVYAHAYLVVRKKFLSDEEGKKLGGVSFALKYGKAREMAAQTRFWPTVENCQSLVIDVFHLPKVTAMSANSVVIEET
ncbi:hypothetical protein BD410DRAFT_757348 [Rickenella mellea]|uniref:BTB domain-containing protein n=1 Tax=Rickenella mellea TaxID=50990 RepID=A0A4Y7PGK7_9AGAM|nr:hypothetical protein BD410DRAFT_757348 [Rickenella mellea]